uniref:somatostatin receptor type 4 n=1 Tax=Doryrhamphus excisus TaxID=161450 RepID=UPI0025AE66A5|nr:somatostatin receptor type 4 [Doryrhamphus excisus]XP_057921938.1 somatostatin receptor type 4 [Doryrhamphus excisus]XP_057921939.1 somatostatin receptor type 4 [Doryrhamphus excisus]
MPAIVNLLFNVVSTNTTISFNTVLPLVSLVSLLGGVGGHLLMWMVMVRNPKSRSKPSSILLLNLSLADTGALLTLPCVLLSASFQDWILGDTTCILLGFLTSITVGVEIFSLAALSMLRYRIVAPRMRRPVSLTQVLCIVVAIWLVSVTMALPKVTYVSFSGACTWSVGRDEWLFFLVPAFLLYYVGPLLCIAINCGLIISHLHTCRGFLSGHRRNKKATALLVASTLVFALSWLPYYALEFVNVISPYISPAVPNIGMFSRKLNFWVSTSGPSMETKTRVSLLWEVSSLAAILMVCLAPCWNPPLYFLLSRPAVRQLRALLPDCLQENTVKKRKIRRRIAPVTQIDSKQPQSPVFE